MPFFQGAHGFTINGGSMQDGGNTHIVDNHTHTHTASGGVNIQGVSSPGGNSQMQSMHQSVVVSKPNEQNQGHQPSQFQYANKSPQHSTPASFWPSTNSDTNNRMSGMFSPRGDMNDRSTPAHSNALPNNCGREQTLLAVTHAILQLQGPLNVVFQALERFSDYQAQILTQSSPEVPTTPSTGAASPNVISSTLMDPSTLFPGLQTAALVPLTPNPVTSSHIPSISEAPEIPTSLPVTAGKKWWLWAKKPLKMKLKARRVGTGADF